MHDGTVLEPPQDPVAAAAVAAPSAPSPGVAAAADVASSRRGGEDAAAALRRLAVAVLAGAIAGALVGGVGGRLAMMLLAVLNADATGVVSDDGFRIGQLTRSGTQNLLLVGTFLGVAGSLFWNVLRSLRVGPGWFRVLSLSGGPGIVVGALIVHVDGVDFQRLQPAWLGIALFVALPAAYAALVTVLGDRWLAGEGRLSRAPAALAYAPLLLLVPLAPIAGVVAVGWLALQSVRATAPGRAALDHPLAPWLARAALTVVFAAAVVDLARDVVALT